MTERGDRGGLLGFQEWQGAEGGDSHTDGRRNRCVGKGDEFYFYYSEFQGPRQHSDGDVQGRVKTRV